ncbi:Fe(II)-2OG oxygenase family protein [Acinetobacter seifertii]|uniref:TauD/TfdA family dioxygenase n=1 Tax=Acinetobacter seifertii TaxID=1530123 RepID=UPI00168B2248|nr:TauD/TfdA family dioxygenase [Acinetobacter seifertii]QNX86591.1 TauD/TfdA family dioxygenase [Acinetobacter seifertii]
MKIKEQLEINGYAFIPRWIPEEKTLNIAKFCGEIFSFNNIIGYQSIPEVQQLRPKKKSIPPNLYSSHFGLDYFPLHTDLAHWPTPPRYLMLRCIKGCSSVKTHILAFNKISNDLKSLLVNRAIFSTRPNNYNNSILLPMTFKTNSNIIFYRWDSIFLLPMNSVAKEIQAYFKRIEFADQILNFELLDAGDTLIIDNFKNLHGRSEISNLDSTRIIERVYLKKVY